MFEKLKNLVNRLLKSFKKDFISVKQFDFKRADEFFQTYKDDLIDLAFCMGFDAFIWCPIVEKGEVINLPIGMTNVEGVSYTIRDIPCISYVLKSGTKGKFYCYTEYKKDFKRNLCKYTNPLYNSGSHLKHYFGVFEAEKFKNGMHVFNN